MSSFPFLMTARCFFDLGNECFVECLGIKVICGEAAAGKVCTDFVSSWLESTGDCPVAVLFFGVCRWMTSIWGSVYAHSLHTREKGRS